MQVNKENAVQFLPLVKALALGETVQVRAGGRNNKTDWRDMDSVSFSRNDPADYRIKPKEMFIAVRDDGVAAYTTTPDATTALTKRCGLASDDPRWKVYQLVEVPTA